MLSTVRVLRGWLRTVRHQRLVGQEFTRLGLTPGVLEARAKEIDAATPDFAQTRGQSWAACGEASAAFLALLRELPDQAGPDAVIAHFRAAQRRR